MSSCQGTWRSEHQPVQRKSPLNITSCCQRLPTRREPHLSLKPCAYIELDMQIYNNLAMPYAVQFTRATCCASMSSLALRHLLGAQPGDHPPLRPCCMCTCCQFWVRMLSMLVGILRRPTTSVAGMQVHRALGWCQQLPLGPWPLRRCSSAPAAPATSHRS